MSPIDWAILAKETPKMGLKAIYSPFILPVAYNDYPYCGGKPGRQDNRGGIYIPQPITRWDVFEKKKIGFTKIPRVPGGVSSQGSADLIEVSIEGWIYNDWDVKTGKKKTRSSWNEAEAPAMVLKIFQALKTALQGFQNPKSNELGGFFRLMRYVGPYSEVYKGCTLAPSGITSYRSSDFLHRMRWSARIWVLDPVIISGVEPTEPIVWADIPPGFGV